MCSVQKPSSRMPLFRSASSGIMPEMPTTSTSHKRCSWSASETSDQSASCDITPRLAGREQAFRQLSVDEGKARRFVWTDEAHLQFIETIAKIGILEAVPKAILEHIGHTGISRECVASHLQKHRMSLRLAAGLPPSTLFVPGNLPKLLLAQVRFAATFPVRRTRDCHCDSTLRSGQLPACDVVCSFNFKFLAMVLAVSS